MGKIVRIGGATGHAIDSMMGVPQMVEAGVDYIVMDYMSEGMMSVYARAMKANPAVGYSDNIVSFHIGPQLAGIAAKKIKVIANAGGLNPAGCVAALEKLAREKGLALNIAYVAGDDLRSKEGDFRDAGARDMFTGEPFPEKGVLSINAYLGAFPIAQALKAGADIVITGRIADSAPSLAALIAEFGWTEREYGKLAAGTIIGHLLECGCQSTGGTFTDWADVPNWENMGFPIAECKADGTFVLTKGEGTGGLVSVGTVAEQLLYETSDPQAYFAPDVVCDMSAMKLEQIAPNRVQCSNVIGHAASDTYKVCVTFEDGWRATVYQVIGGMDAPAKAEKQAAALFTRVDKLLQGRNLGPFTRTASSGWGSGSSFGERGFRADTREVVCRLIVDHPEKEAVDLFTKEQSAVYCSMSVGSTGSFGATVVPLSKLNSFLLDKNEVSVKIVMNGVEIPASTSTKGGFDVSHLERPSVNQPVISGDLDGQVRLIDLAVARSGEKGNLFNVGVIARRPEYLPFIRATLTTEKVGQWFVHAFDDPDGHRVDRYELPGFDALNFVVHNAMGGGLTNTVRVDSAAKTMAQQLLEMPIAVPESLAREFASASA